MNSAAQETIALLREVGFSRLAAFDGCVCSSVKVREFEIEVGCRKGSGGHIGAKIWPGFYGTIVRVSSHSMDADEHGCALVAEEVRRQVHAVGSDSETNIRLCSYTDDAEGRCSYCHKPRAERWGYYCAEHLTPESRDPWGIHAQGIEAATADETPQAAQPEGREPGPAQQDAPDPSSESPHP